nr:hypothetical protein [Mycobacterium neglectum]
MDFKRTVGAAVLAGGIAIAGVLGVGLGSAVAQPGGCGTPNSPSCGPNRPGGPNQPGHNQPGAGPNWQARGIDHGRQDHQPFNWNGRQVTPMPAGNGQAWGFWFLGQWIPL